MRPPSSSPDDAFARAFREYYAGMCQFVRRYVHSAAAAEDIVQGVWATLWQRGDTERLTKAYLYAAARNRALHDVAHRAVEARHADVMRMDSGERDEADAVELAELAAAADRAITALPERCRTIYQMVRNDGLSYADVAAILNISVSTVEVQMWRALKKIRQAMEPYLGSL